MPNGGLWKILLTSLIGVVVAAASYVVTQQREALLDVRQQQNERLQEIRQDLRELMREVRQLQQANNTLQWRLSQLERATWQRYPEVQ
jgi:uncharacterized protein YlxW (UPF0749 family)